MKLYKYLCAFARAMLRASVRFGMRTNFVAFHYECLGAHAPDIPLTGKMKYDQTLAPLS